MKQITRLLLISSALVLTPAFANASEGWDFPSPEQIRARKEAAMNSQQQERAQQAHQAAQEQVRKLGQRIEQNPIGPIYWNQNHDEGELSQEAIDFLIGRTCRVTPKSGVYYADDCNCGANWGCTHPDPTDKRTYAYYEITW